MKIGIVGLGKISKDAHIPVLSTFEDVEINAASEIDAKRGESIAKKWNIPEIYVDYNEMYENSSLDAVFVCLPNFLHYDAVEKALKNNLHVFCEKTMGLSSNEAYELVKMAKNKNLILAVGYNKRLFEKYEKAAQIIRGLTLGNILQIHGVLVSQGPYVDWIPSSDWFFDEKAGGVLYDSGCHLIDLMTYILSDRIDEVSARAIDTMGLNVFDNVACVFKTEKGTIGTINIGWKTAIIYDSIQIHGTAGSLFVSTDCIEEMYGGFSVLDKIAGNMKYAKKIVLQGLLKKGGSKGRPHETYFKEDKAFINAIKHDEKPYASGEDALHVLEVLEGIRESLQSKKIVKVKNHDNT